MTCSPLLQLVTTFDASQQHAGVRHSGRGKSASRSTATRKQTAQAKPGRVETGIQGGTPTGCRTAQRETRRAGPAQEFRTHLPKHKYKGVPWCCTETTQQDNLPPRVQDTPTQSQTPTQKQIQRRALAMGQIPPGRPPAWQSLQASAAGR